MTAPKRVELNRSPGYRQTLARRDARVQPPCVTCSTIQRCAALRLACRDYMDYAQTGRQRDRERHPNRQMFLESEDETV
jgi:hypothetical protein